MLSDDDIGILEDIYKAEPGDIVFFDIDWSAVTFDDHSCLKFVTTGLWRWGNTTKLDETANVYKSLLLDEHGGQIEYFVPL